MYYKTENGKHDRPPNHFDFCNISWSNWFCSVSVTMWKWILQPRNRRLKTHCVLQLWCDWKFLWSDKLWQCIWKYSQVRYIRLFHQRHFVAYKYLQNHSCKSGSYDHTFNPHCTVAHPTRHSFKPKISSHSIKKLLSLAVTWVKVVKKLQNSDFQS